MKLRYYIISILFINLMPTESQTIKLADSITSEIIFRKHLKARFFSSCAYITLENNPDSMLQNKNELWFGDHFIRETAYAFGDWALKPDFKVYKIDLKSPWIGYDIYDLEIPKHTNRNDSIAGYYVDRDNLLNRIFEPHNPLEGNFLLAFNKKTGKLFYLNLPLHVSSYYSSDDIFRKKFPNFNFSGYTKDIYTHRLAILSPINELECKKKIASELMKNIYSYRFIKTGILDSIQEKNGFLKDDKEQFPLVDSLVPEYDENLYMKAEIILDNGRMEYWRFEYPGYDSLYNSYGGHRNKSWEKFLKLKRQYYVVGYDIKRGFIHFISGNFYLTKFADFYMPHSDKEIIINDPKSFSLKRQWYVEDRMYSLCPDLYYKLKNQLALEINGEDENYWYYIIHSVIPYNRTINIYDDLTGEIVSKMCCIPPDYKYCDYKVRMSKINWEIVEIMEAIKCHDE